MAVVVGCLLAALGEREELVAHVDERHPGHDAAQVELEEPAVEGQRLLDVSDLEGHVVDPDEARERARIHARELVMRTTRTTPADLERSNQGGAT